MQHLGDPSFVIDSGGKTELILLDESGPRYVVHRDLFDPSYQFSAQSGGTGTAMLSVRLKASGDVLRIPEMRYVEVWAEPPGPPPERFCIGKFRIDYWHASFDEVSSEITIQARGPLGMLVDQPRRLVFKGELPQLVANICATSAPTEVAGFSSHPINVYVNMDSTYAALRLMAISVGFVIREEREAFTIRVSEQKYERERVEAKPMLEINDSNSFGGTYTKGAPLKKRT